ncbi:cell division protein ZipA C-terminal FtsZ-binding domain-containing protein [Neisseria sp.]|uniref:cell division protein ZipA C-terminal FtsZ-binding domain-containing protein n=1 Tax=Neisseria sp. TaxID=192066 RepID=UPI0035A060F8
MVIIIIGLAVILSVLAYNYYQESQYRKKIREDLGQSEQEAGSEAQPKKIRENKSRKGLKSAGDGKDAAVRQAARSNQERNDLFAMKVEQTAAAKPDIEIEIEDDFDTSAPVTPTFENTVPPAAAKTAKPQAVRKDLVDLDELAKVELPWFDPRFDYMAYIALNEAQELHALPRLSGRHRFQIIGCTMDDRFQIAEPIPSVYYQGFVIGLQAVSRSGLATLDELEQFNEHVTQFAEQMDGKLMLTDIPTFLSVAEPLDMLCARVDQTIAIHLVSHTNISGVELRSAVESNGFGLGADGAFHYPANETEYPLFDIVTLDNTAFTPALLSAQAYRGFSMLFDIPHIPAGEKTFDRFMDLAVKLSGQLGLDLVNDKLEELSTQWLKDVRNFVLARQDEMLKVGIKPGSETAKRLFS